MKRSQACNSGKERARIVAEKLFNEIVSDKGKTTVPRRQQDLQLSEHSIKITIIVRLSGMQLEKHRSKLVAPVSTAHTVDKLFILRAVNND